MDQTRMIAWAIFAVWTAFPMAYVGNQIGWSFVTILAVLAWGALTAGVAVEIDRRTR